MVPRISSLSSDGILIIKFSEAIKITADINEKIAETLSRQLVNIEDQEIVMMENAPII